MDMDLQGVHVLLVDDDEATRYWLRRMLEQLGARVEAAASAREALAMVSAHVPDVVLCDIAMPDEDGYSLIRSVRGLPAEQGGAVPAVALTAYAVVPSMVERSLASGFQAHLQKPMQPQDIVRVVRDAVGASGTGGA